MHQRRLARRGLAWFRLPCHCRRISASEAPLDVRASIRLSREGGFMRRLRVGTLDLVTQGPARALYSRLMNATLAGIMPQVLGLWCEKAGHDVRLVCYTGFEDLSAELPADTDVLFISAFSQTALLAYA